MRFLQKTAGRIAEIVHRLRRARFALSQSVAVQEEAEESRARLAAIVESAYEGVVGCTLEGLITSWNNGAKRIFGYPAEEVLGKPVHVLVPPDQAQFARQVFDRIRNRQSGTSLETVAVRRDGRHIHVLLGLAPIANPAGAVIAAAFTVHDITDRRRAEEALRESEARLRAILDRASAVVYLKDRAGRYLFINEEFLRIFGTKRDAVLGRNEYDLFPPATAAQLRAHAKRVWDGETPFTAEETVPQMDGVHTYVATKFLLRDLSGEAYALCGISTDITSQKRVEDALRAANRTKDIFLATLSHELRNPLAPIRQSARLLQMENLGAAEAKRARDIIDRQAGHMSRLLDDLLDVSRITRGSLELRKESVDLATSVDAALEIVRPLIEARRHNVTFDLPRNALRIDADAARLAQILANLLTNAGKYTQEGGTIRVQVGREGYEAVVRVIDNGPGISEDALPRIFEMFSQGKSERQHAEGGLGIGLALVRGLVSLHGGTIEARSEGPGQGSEFIVRLPIGQDASLSVGASLPAEASQSGAPREILIADDNRDAADSLRIMLEGDGHRVHAVYDGRAALDAAEALRPEIALLDIGMPELTGHEVAEHIRSRPWGADVTLVALTGWGQTHDKQRATDAGFDHHVTKPMDPDRLRQLIAGLPARGSSAAMH
jgi:PAS domain S-box-containing protein